MKTFRKNNKTFQHIQISIRFSNAYRDEKQKCADGSWGGGGLLSGIFWGIVAVEELIIHPSFPPLICFGNGISY